MVCWLNLPSQLLQTDWKGVVVWTLKRICLHFVSLRNMCCGIWYRLMWVKDLLLDCGCILRERKTTCWLSIFSIYARFLKFCSFRMTHTITELLNHMTASTSNHLDPGSVSLMSTRNQWNLTMTPQSWLGHSYTWAAMDWGKSSSSASVSPKSSMLHLSRILNGKDHQIWVRSLGSSRRSLARISPRRLRSLPLAQLMWTSIRLCTLAVHLCLCRPQSCSSLWTQQRCCGDRRTRRDTGWSLVRNCSSRGASYHCGWSTRSWQPWYLMMSIHSMNIVETQYLETLMCN